MVSTHDVIVYCGRDRAVKKGELPTQLLVIGQQMGD